MRSLVYYSALATGGFVLAIAALSGANRIFHGHWVIASRAHYPTTNDITLQPRTGQWESVVSLLIKGTPDSPRDVDTFIDTLELPKQQLTEVNPKSIELSKGKYPVLIELPKELGGLGLLLTTNQDRGSLCMQYGGAVEWLSLNENDLASSKHLSLLEREGAPSGLWFPTKSVNVGQLNRDQPQRVDVWIPVYRKDISNITVDANCGCVTVIDHSTAVQAGDVMHLQLLLDLRSREYDASIFEQSITINYSASIVDSFELGLVGRVRRPARLNNPIINLGAVIESTMNNPVRVSFTVNDPDRHISAITAIDLPIGVEWLGAKREDENIHITCSVVPSIIKRGVRGHFSARIKMLASRHQMAKRGNPEMQYLDGEITGVIKSEFGVEPKTIYAGLMGRRESTSRVITITGDGDLEDVFIETTNSGLAAVKRNGRTIECEIVAPNEIGFFHSDILVTVNGVTKAVSIVGAVDI